MDTEQLVLGGVFSLMGLGTMLFPSPLLKLSLNNAEVADSPELNLVFRCFGAQATLCGLLLLSCRFTKTTYRNFGLAMIPFYVFDYLAWRANFLTPLGAIGDALGNTVFSVCCYLGWQKKNAKQESSI